MKVKIYAVGMLSLLIR